jgi:hypothetical protein
MKAFKPDQKVTFCNSDRVIFHLTVVESDEDITTCRHPDGATNRFHTSDLEAAGGE